MKIHYSAPAWHGGFGRFMTKAFKSFGHDVYFFNDNGSPRQEILRKALTRIPKMNYWIEDQFRNVVSRDWLASVRRENPDLLILQHTPNILPEYIREAKRSGSKIVCWMDSPPAGTQAKDALAGMEEADIVYTIDRKWMTLLYAPEDFTHLPLAGDPETFHPMGGAEKKYDAVFVGSFPPDSGDGYLRAKIIADISEKYRVAAFGNGADYWVKYFPILKKRVRSGALLSAEKLNEIYDQTEIVLNLHSTWHTSSLSARTYEIALAGAFQLVDWREDLDILFPKNSFATFRYAKEVNGLIEAWLNKPAERIERAKKIREHVLSHHTWRHRAETLLRSLEHKSTRA